jgi:predicted membrane-bound mannosyltransferase
MSKVTSYLQKNYISFLLLGLLIFVYFILRLPNLTLLPVFADEAIYIRWAQVMKSEPTLRFLPISDGKTPLFMWIMMPLFKIFEEVQ